MLNVLVDCGNLTGIPETLPNIVHYLILAIQIIIPIVLIVFGMLDMGKAVISNDEKVMKENQNKLIRRIVYAVLVFLVIAIVKVVVGMVANVGGDDAVATGDDIGRCIDLFLNGA